MEIFVSNPIAGLGTILTLYLAAAHPGIILQNSADIASATLVTDAEIRTIIDAAPEDRVSDVQLRMVDAGGYNIGIGVVQRPASAPGGAIEHDKQTEIYRIVAGSGTLITGGELIDSRRLANDGDVVKNLTGPSSVGSGIRGGESRQVTAGDMVIIPAGVPHGFSALQADTTYLVVRVDPEQLVQLK